MNELYLKKLCNMSNLEIFTTTHLHNVVKKNQRASYPGCLKYYELAFYISGKNNVTFQNRKLYDKSNTIRYLPRSVENNKYYIDCIEEGEFVNIFFATDSPMPHVAFTMDVTDSSRLSHLFINLHLAHEKKRPGYQSKCRSIFYEILYEMELCSSITNSNSHFKTIENSINYISSHCYDTDLDYVTIAKQSGISYTYFKKLFYEIYKLTPSEYIKNQRLSKACEMLGTKCFTIAQIANMCGYDNIYYFSKLFKKTFGVPPSKYNTMK